MPCSYATPFAGPVLPDVKITAAASVRETAGGAKSGDPAARNRSHAAPRTGTHARTPRSRPTARAT